MNYKKCIFYILSLLIIPHFAAKSVLSSEAGTWSFQFSMEADVNSLPLKNPQTLFIDTPSERYYISDSGNNRLLSFDKSGVPLQTFDAEGTIDKPVGMVKQGNNILFILEKGKGGVTRVNLKTKEVKTEQLFYKKQKLYPHRIKQIDKIIVILDKVTGRLFTFSENNLTNAKIIHCSECNNPFVDFTINNSIIYAITEGFGQIKTISLDGRVGEIMLSPPPDFPSSLAIDKHNNLFILERHRALVSVYNINGKKKYQFLGKGAKYGQLYYPSDVQFDPWGRLCIVEEGNGRVTVFSQ